MMAQESLISIAQSMPKEVQFYKWRENDVFTHGQYGLATDRGHEISALNIALQTISVK